MENFVKKFQRSIAGLGLVALLASFVSFAGVASALSFADVDSDNYAFDQIDALSDAGIMTGYAGTDDFGTNDYLTKEQAAKILVLAFVGSTDADYDAGFPDVVAGEWYVPYVNTAELYGIVEGNPDSTFGVGETVNRATFAKMVVDAAGLENDGTLASDMFSDVDSGAWYDTYMGTAYVYSIMSGYANDNMGPGDSIVRAAAAKMTYNAMYPVYIGEDEEPTDPTSSDATVQVTLSDDSAVAGTIPSNATSVALASFDFTAEGDDAIVDGLTVHQYGISNVATSTVYLYNGSERLTSGTTVNSSTHEATFNHLDVAVAEGDTVTLTVRMDVADQTATGEVGFELASAEKVDADTATVEGDFPVSGDKFSLSTTDAGTVSVLKNGTVDDAQVGEDTVTVSKFQLSLDSTEGGLVKEIGLYVAGTISTADVENFNLYVSGDDSEAIATAEATDDLDVVRFDLGEGYAMEKGATKSFYVTADLNTGRTGDTLTFYVDQDTDVLVEGALYGYGLSVNRKGYDGGTDSTVETAGTCTASTSDCTYQTLVGGDITISSNGPTATDVAINGKDVVLLNFSVVTVSDVTFDNFPVALTASEDTTDDTEGLLNGTTSNLTDIKVVDTDTGELADFSSSVDSSSFTTATIGGTVIDDTTTDTDDTISYYLWTDNWEAVAGSEYNFALKTDVANTSTLNNMTIIGSLPFDTTYPTMKDVNNKTLTNSSVLVPTSTITGKTMTIKSPSLTLSLSSSLSGANTYVKGTSDVEFAALVFACGGASDCEITDVVLQGYLDDNGGADAWKTIAAGGDWDTALSTYVGSISLMVGDTEIANAGVNTSNFTATFDNITDWTIDAGETQTVYVVGDLTTSAYANADVENIAFGISLASNVTVYDEDGSSFAPTGTPNATTPSVYALTSAGGVLTVATAGSTARENIVVGGASDVEVSSFEFTSTLEPFVVTKLSLNARQSAYTAPADYDNNYYTVKIAYEDENGDTLTKTTSLVSGTADFNELELYVPTTGSATLTAYVTVNPFTSTGTSATAGEFIDLALSYDDFSALAQGSGEVYTGANIDATTVATGAYLSFGTITWTDSSAHDINTAVATLAALGSAQTLVINDEANTDPANLPVGTLLCIDGVTVNAACDATESRLVVTAWTEGTAFTDAGNTGDTVTATVIDNADTAFADADNILYSLPGSGYHTGTNQMVVYESKPTLALSSSSPTSANPSTAEKPFYFSVTSPSTNGDKIQLRTAEVNDCTTVNADFNDTALVGNAWTVVGTSTAPATGGVGNSAYLNAVSVATAASFTYTFTTANQNLSAYNGISFWVKTDDNDATVVATLDDDAGTDPAVTSSTLVADTWTFVDYEFTAAVKGAANVNIDAIDTIAFAFTNETDTKYFALDRVVLYKEKLTIDVTAGDGDLDTSTAGTDTTAGAADNLVAYLKETGGATQATGYFYSSTQTADASSGSITFYPQAGTDTGITIDRNGSATYYLEMDTVSLVDQEGGVEDPVQFSVDLGTSSSGTVTAGDLWWYETNATVKWLGYLTSGTTVYSGSLKY